MLTSSLGFGSGDWLPGARPAPEQHARRGRSDPRAARARAADGQHDAADPRARRRRASRSPAARPAAPGCAARSSRCWPGSLDEGLDATGGGRPATAPPGRGDRSRGAGTPGRGHAGARGGRLRGARLARSRTTSSAASASSRGRVRRAILGEAGPQPRFLRADRRPAQVAALGAPGIRRGRAAAGRLRVDAGAVEAANRLQHLQRPSRLLPCPADTEKCRNLRLAVLLGCGGAGADGHPADAAAVWTRLGLALDVAREPVFGAAVEAANELAPFDERPFLHAR